jgi:hypothetical protein
MSRELDEGSGDGKGLETEGGPLVACTVVAEWAGNLRGMHRIEEQKNRLDSQRIFRSKRNRCLGRFRGEWLAGMLVSLMPGAAWAQAVNQLALPGYLQGSAAARPMGTTGGSPMSDFRGMPGGAGLPFQSPMWNPSSGPGGATVGGGDGSIWERLRLNFFASVAFTYSDNALQGTSETGSADDFSINPLLGAGADWQLTEHSRLNFQAGVGYRYSLNYDDLTQITLVPTGSLDYSFLVGDVLFTVFNAISSPPELRTEIVGSGLPTGVDFNRIINQTGLTALWAATDSTAFSAGYSYLLNRGLSDNSQFAVLDQSAHMVNGGVFHRLSPYWTVGLSAQASKAQFTEQFQNDSTSYGVGPLVSFRPTEYLTIMVSMQYTIMEFSTGGAVGDNQEFSGLTWQGGVQHRLTERINHGVNFMSGVNSGLGSNFTEMTTVNYNLIWQFMRRMSLNVMFDYSNFKQSGSVTAPVIVEVPGGFFEVPVTFITNDSGDQYNFMIGTGLQITEHLNAAISYMYSLRESRFAERSFDANSFNLFLNYMF